MISKLPKPLRLRKFFISIMPQKESSCMSMNIPPRNMSTITCPIFITGMGMRNKKWCKITRKVKDEKKLY